MAKCDIGVGGDDGGFGFRLWPLFSAAALRRRIIDAVMCGGASRKRKVRNARKRSSPAPEERSKQGSDRLSELLRAEGSESELDEVEAETRRKAEAYEEIQYIVRKLQFAGTGDQRRETAEDVRRLAKDNAEARETLAMLGAVPPLVEMLDSDDPQLQISSLYALLNLGVGNDVNKAAIVNAGAVHKMLKLIESESSRSVTEAIIANFLGLTALDSNKSIIGASGAIPFLVKNVSDPNSASQSRHDSLRALFNLSLSTSNVPHLVDSGLVPLLLASIGDMEVSERVLSVLSNVVSTPEGRRAVSRAADAFPALIDVLNWTDSPECQEKAAYVLMVMAHKACNDRTVMIEAGIVSSLLELTLIGTALAQKRASRILECLMVDKGKQVSERFDCGNGGCSSSWPAVSAPIWSGGKRKEVVEESGVMSEERKAVKQLVQQSLQNNMRRIVKRANLPQDFVPSDQFRALTVSETSKSLPF